jgi:hypothetical protein
MSPAGTSVNWPDVAPQFGHEALAETHHFIVALALGVEVAAALATAHGQGGQAVLEGLLEAQELQDAEVHAGVETQTALVGSDGAVELDAEAAVHLRVALVIHPWHAEDDGALGLHHTLQEHFALVLGVRLDERDHHFGHFMHGLKEFRLIAIALFDGCHEGVHSLVALCHRWDVGWNWARRYAEDRSGKGQFRRERTGYQWPLVERLCAQFTA